MSVRVDSNAPSRTARLAAIHRAAHQVLERGAIFEDPLALRILGPDAEALVRDAEARPQTRLMRLFIAIRTRFAEDALAAAVGKGVSQLVVLGAGLDTFAYRSPFGQRLKVFEVDHPATQAWKRAQLGAAAIALPDTLTFVPIDFEQQVLADQLVAGGFDPHRRSFFSWLGVVPYLTRAAVFANLEFIASLPGGAHVAFDYADPPQSFAAEQQAAHERFAGRVAALGEALITYFDASELARELAGLGFSELDDLNPLEMRRRYLPSLSEAAQTRGAHVMHAQTADR